MGSDRSDRGRDDRVRHGDRQGRYPRRLPLQPAQEPGELRPGDRPGRAATAQPSVVRAAGVPGRRADAGELHLRRHADAEALAGVLDEVLGTRWASEFDVSDYELSARHDIRPLVVRDAADVPGAGRRCCGRGRRSTPATRSARWRDRSTISSRASTNPRSDFLRRVFESGTTGRTWTTIDPEASAAALGAARSRVVAALDYLDQQGLAEVRAADVRQRYTRSLQQPPSLDELRRRGRRAPRSDVSSRRRPVSAMCSRSSSTTAARYGSSPRISARIRHRRLRPLQPLPRRPAVAWARLRRGPTSTPSPIARPSTHSPRRTPTRSARRASSRGSSAGSRALATTRAKLTREPLFGSLSDYGFRDVLAWATS